MKGWLESDCNKQRENFQQHKSNELQVSEEQHNFKNI